MYPEGTWQQTADNQVYYVFIDPDDFSDPRHFLADGLADYINKKLWPKDFPITINDAKWCFCFAGEPFSTVIQTLAHQQRTRYAKGVTIVFQPKWTFDILFSSDAKCASALPKVRVLLAKYDPIPVSLDSKKYGEPDSREFQQYFLMDENIPTTMLYAKLSASTELKMNEEKRDVVQLRFDTFVEWSYKASWTFIEHMYLYYPNPLHINY
ncbi:hypothetical protein AN958_02987 [Leucoagaricus sp. SymC.cos]|nr:hypothetical protein AN958_02987 [Leucoagaricus sp. SymC.cos]